MVLKKENKAETFNVFPNPTSGRFKIQLTVESIKTSLLVLDVLGNNIFKQEINGSEALIDLSSQAKGLYFVEIITDGKRSVKKIIIE